MENNGNENDRSFYEILRSKVFPVKPGDSTAKRAGKKFGFSIFFILFLIISLLLGAALLMAF